MYSEKATKSCEISTVDLSYVLPVKSTVDISQNFVAFSEHMNFTFEARQEEAKEKKEGEIVQKVISFH